MGICFRRAGLVKGKPCFSRAACFFLAKALCLWGETLFLSTSRSHEGETVSLGVKPQATVLKLFHPGRLMETLVMMQSSALDCPILNCTRAHSFRPMPARFPWARRCRGGPGPGFSGFGLFRARQGLGFRVWALGFRV